MILWSIYSTMFTLHQREHFQHPFTWLSWSYCAVSNHFQIKTTDISVHVSHLVPAMPPYNREIAQSQPPTCSDSHRAEMALYVNRLCISTSKSLAANKQSRSKHQAGMTKISPPHHLPGISSPCEVPGKEAVLEPWRIPKVKVLIHFAPQPQVNIGTHQLQKHKVKQQLRRTRAQRNFCQPMPGEKARNFYTHHNRI